MLKYLLGFIIFIQCSFVSYSCDGTYGSIDSLVLVGTNFKIYMSITMGGGFMGAGGGTTNVFFGFNSSTGINVISYSPSTITSDTTGCTIFGGNYGPVGAPMNTDATIGYVDLSGCPNSFLCTGSPSTCGTAHTQTFQFCFLVDAVPDSLTVFGIEGAGNPMAGCINEDRDEVTFTFTVSTQGVNFGEIVGVREKENCRILWDTYSEWDNSHFQIERSPNGINFESIGKLNGAGTSFKPLQYQFVDSSEFIGTCYYRIRQVDFNGETTHSEIIAVNRGGQKSMAFPNPASNSIRFMGEERIEKITFFSSHSTMIKEIFVDQKKSKNIDISNLAAGVYFVQIEFVDQGNYIHRIVKE